MDLVDRAVDGEVEPGAEEVLVDRGGETRAPPSIPRVAPVPSTGSLVDMMPGELDLELDGAVEVEVPEEAVLVVADGGDGGDHQAPGPAHLGAAGVHVGCFQRIP